MPVFVAVSNNIGAIAVFVVSIASIEFPRSVLKPLLASLGTTCNIIKIYGILGMQKLKIYVSCDCRFYYCMPSGLLQVDPLSFA